MVRNFIAHWKAWKRRLRRKAAQSEIDNFVSSTSSLLQRDFGLTLESARAWEATWLRKRPSKSRSLLRTIARCRAEQAAGERRSNSAWMPTSISILEIESRTLPARS